MNKKQIIFTIMLLCLTNVCTWFFSAHEIYMAQDVSKDGKTSINYPHFYNIRNAYYTEREYCGCMMEMLHDYWEFKDIEWTNDGQPVGKHDFWNEVIMESDAYHTADSINGGDWEDFYYHWYTEDDCGHEK